uniref:Homeobox domain-containing protein n=2 Tax=Caenorhabditis japonica TaxID=281687 RepID=A0A8R1I290_CAEJA
MTSTENPPQFDPPLLEFCKNLLFASHYKTCTTASELLQKVVALKCIQDSGIMMLQQPCTSTYDEPMEVQVPEDEEEEEPVEDEEDIFNSDVPNVNNNGTPLFFNSMTVVIQNLQKAGVDREVSESIALDRLSAPSANPLSFMGGLVINGKKLCKIDSEKIHFVKKLLQKMHNQEEFNSDGAPYSYDVRAALRYSERLHSQIPPLGLINPPHVAHEQSITLTAMARFMAMHESIDHFDLKIMFPVDTEYLEQHAYFSALFWTYREAFKAYYYPTMPAPLPASFQLTPIERNVLRRYWNAGNRHVTATEAFLLSKRLPSLAPYQIYGFFDKRRRREYAKYCHDKDRETLARESTVTLKKLREIGKQIEEESDDEDDTFHIERDLSREETAKLELMWTFGHRNPSRNECELWAVHWDIQHSEQMYAYFEDRRWREAFQKKKNSQKPCHVPSTSADVI